MVRGATRCVYKKFTISGGFVVQRSPSPSWKETNERMAERRHTIVWYDLNCASPQNTSNVGHSLPSITLSLMLLKPYGDNRVPTRENVFCLVRAYQIAFASTTEIKEIVVVDALCEEALMLVTAASKGDLVHRSYELAMSFFLKQGRRCSIHQAIPSSPFNHNIRGFRLLLAP